MKIYPRQKGITTARLKSQDYFEQDHVIQFLHLHRHSLEIFDYRDGIAKEDDAFCEISNGRVIKTDQGRNASLHPDNDPSETRTLLTRLVYLSLLEIEHPLAVPFIRWMILNAPNLKSIQLTESEFEIRITSSLIRSKHLSRLEIIDVFADDDDDNGIQPFLEYHIALGERSTLEHVIIRMGWSADMSDVPWIPLLSRLKRLKT
ncbi:hypothetical protein K492DRAFT_200339 [Lichtheimia hyalospora FSU 10163]|nr:hypothetical protein K492DRAFT_200339 [Lichtheimia hyalospora FSU 10163]